MSSIKVGTTNLNGNGSAADLDSQHNQLTGAGVNTVNASSVYDTGTNISAAAASWNEADAKEVKIDAVNKDVLTRNFVDADINLQDSDQDVSVKVINAKRGTIDTGTGNDTVEVRVLTNNEGWSNHFEVNTGEGNDRIIFKDAQNSKFTSVDIDAGDGDDYINLNRLEASSDDVERFVDGGNGNDIIFGSEGSDTIFGGYGNDLIKSGSGNDQVWGDHGNDKIYAGAGNDSVDGGAGVDMIFAGSGNDQVFFDQSDSVISGGAGFDSLVVNGTADVAVSSGFEAIISNNNTNSVDNVNAVLQDGLVVMLGGDFGDSITFAPSTTFTAISVSFDDMQAATSGTDKVDMLDLVNAQGYSVEDIEALNGYQANTGEIVWSDVDLLA